MLELSEKWGFVLVNGNGRYHGGDEAPDGYDPKEAKFFHEMEDARNFADTINNFLVDGPFRYTLKPFPLLLSAHAMRQCFRSL